MGEAYIFISLCLFQSVCSSWTTVRFGTGMVCDRQSWETVRHINAFYLPHMTTILYVRHMNWNCETFEINIFSKARTTLKAVGGGGRSIFWTHRIMDLWEVWDWFYTSIWSPKFLTPTYLKTNSMSRLFRKWKKLHVAPSNFDLHFTSKKKIPENCFQNIHIHYEFVLSTPSRGRRESCPERQVNVEQLMHTSWIRWLLLPYSSPTGLLVTHSQYFIS